MTANNFVTAQCTAAKFRTQTSVVHGRDMD